MTLSLQATKVLLESDEETGYLVFVDHHLAAVLVRLDGAYHGSDQGSWNVEAGFGPCDVRSCDPFPGLGEALAWVAARVGAPAASVAHAMSGIRNGEDRPGAA